MNLRLSQVYFCITIHIASCIYWPQIPLLDRARISWSANDSTYGLKVTVSITLSQSYWRGHLRDQSVEVISSHLIVASAVDQLIPAVKHDLPLLKADTLVRRLASNENVKPVMQVSGKGNLISNNHGVTNRLILPSGLWVLTMSIAPSNTFIHSLTFCLSRSTLTAVSLKPSNTRSENCSGSSSMSA